MLQYVSVHPASKAIQLLLALRLVAAATLIVLQMKSVILFLEMALPERNVSLYAGLVIVLLGQNALQEITQKFALASFP